MLRRSLLIGAPVALILPPAIIRPAQALTPAQQAILFSGGAPSWVLRGTVPADLDFDFANGRYYQNGLGLLSASQALTVSRASTGYAADTNGNWTSFASGVARITNQGLLVEEARTNVSTFSQAMAGNWSATASSLTGGQSDPFGGSNASLFTSDGTNALHFIQSGNTFSFVSATAYTTSFLVKYSSEQYVQITFPSAQFGSSQYANFDLIGKTVTASSGGTAFITSYANGWMRIAWSAAATSSSAGAPAILVAIPNGSSTRAPSLTSANSTFVIQGQTETGAFPTSPILTTSGSVARAADVVTVTRVPAFGNAYSLFACGVPVAPDSYGTTQIIGQISNTDNNRLGIFRSSAAGDGTNWSGGSPSTQNPSFTWSVNTSAKSMVASAASDQAISFNGGAVATTAGALPVGVNSIQIGRDSSNAYFDGYVSRIAVWAATRQPNATLRALTQ